jgi:hypothetical protein
MGDYNWEQILDNEGNVIGFEKVAIESDAEKENRFNTIKNSLLKDKDRCVTHKVSLEAELAKFLVDIPSSDAKDQYAADMQSFIDQCSEEIESYDAAISKIETKISNIYEEMIEIDPPTPPTPDPEEESEEEGEG